MIRKALLVAGATLAISTAAYATITFDSATGTGFVGKGDVQYTYAWNNAQLQNAALGIAFSYEQSTAFDVTCEWETETGGKNSKTIEHAVTNHKVASITSSIDVEARKMKQFTGFILKGFGDTTTTGGTIPSVGDSCPQAHSSAVVTEVVESGDNAPGALYVSSNGDKRLLLEKPVTITTTL